MARFVVLLRGVNVGKGKRVPMAEFKALLEKLGCTRVKTLLNSGNAAFSSTGRSTARHAAAISAALRDRLGVDVLVIVKSAADLAAIVDGVPVRPPETEHSRFLVAFGPDAASLGSLEPLKGLVRPPETFVLTPRAAYLHCAAGILTSKAGEALLGKTGRGVTTRNLATVLKLHALAGDTD